MRPPRLDAALAVALLAAKVGLAAGGVQTAGAAAFVLAPFLTLPLAWRRRLPLAVATVVLGANAIETAVAGFHDSVVALAVFILVPYSIAAYCRGVREMTLGLAACVAVGAYEQAMQPAPGSFPAFASMVAGDAALLLVPFLAGLAMRQQRLRARTLEQLAERLEHEREERARLAVAEERTRIARELHDEVAHAMSVIAVQADAAEGALHHDPALVQTPLVAIRDTARGALADMRRVLGALRADEAASFAPEPGLARIDALLEQARASGLEVALRIEGEPVPLPPALDLAAYRVVQEGLTNVRKHAGARRVDVAIRYGEGALTVEVDDDGDGSGSGGGTGRGLAGLRERAALLQGELVAGPRARGFTVRVRLPLA